MHSNVNEIKILVCQKFYWWIMYIWTECIFKCINYEIGNVCLLFLLRGVLFILYIYIHIYIIADVYLYVYVKFMYLNERATF